MQTDMKFTLLKGDSMGVETDYRDALPVNMTGVIRELFGAQGYMLMLEGLTKYGDGVGVDRRGIWNERHLEHYRVSGDKFIKVDVDGVYTELGTVAGVETDTVSLPYSFNTQGIVAGGEFYLYDEIGGFRKVAIEEVGNPIDCVWVDGYYMLTDGANLYHTELANEADINPLAYATSEIQPDPTLGLGRTVDNKVIVFNRYSTEYFSNVASENFAFTRIAGRLLKSGIVGTHCKCEMEGRWYTMGGRKEEPVTINTLSVGNVEKVSSREVDKILGDFTEAQLSLSVLEARVIDGYNFLLVHLPDRTLLFNSQVAQVAGVEQAWSILRTDVHTDVQTGYRDYRGKFGVFEPRKGVWVYGDKEDSTLGILDDSVATHYGELAEWVLFSPYLFIDKLSIDELEIETVAGHTIEPDATVALSMTYDGVTYGKEWFMQYGRESAYQTRFISRRLGYVNEWCGFKLRGASTSRMAFSRGKLKVG